MDVQMLLDEQEKVHWYSWDSYQIHTDKLPMMSPKHYCQFHLLSYTVFCFVFKV